jgi:hypothetical protein
MSAFPLRLSLQENCLAQHFHYFLFITPSHQTSGKEAQSSWDLLSLPSILSGNNISIAPASYIVWISLE